MQHDLGHTAGEKGLHRDVILRSIRQHIDEARRLAIDAIPVGDDGATTTSGMGDGGHVQQQIRRTTEGGVHDHGIVNRLVCDDVVAGDARLFQGQQGASGAHGQIGPDRFS